MAVTRRVRTPAKTAAPAKADKPAKAKGGVSAELSAADERRARDEALTKQVVKLRDSGSKWSEIGDEVGIATGKAIFLYEVHSVDESERIKYKNETDLGLKLLKLRGTTSWGRLAARAGLPESRLKKLFVEAGGEENSRIGKGGRHAGAVGATAAKPAPRTRTKAKASAEKPALPAPRTRAKKK